MSGEEGFELPFEEIDRLLEPGYLPLESGYIKLSDEHFLVAVLTQMPLCRKEMVDWWFAYGLSPKEHTPMYKLWHPADHVHGSWDDKWSPGSYVGASHLAEESFGDFPAAKLRIKFREPTEFFTASKFERANVVAVCAQVFFRLEDEEVEIAKMTHLVRDTSMGCEMRTRFWLEPVAGYEVAGKLFQHSVEEMRNLAQILPYLHKQWEAKKPH